MTENAPTDIETAAHINAFHDAYRAAAAHRRALHGRAAVCVAHLIRKHLPDAATLIVDTDWKELHEVLDAKGDALWHAPSSAGRGLPDTTIEKIDGILVDTIPFGSLAGAAGWETAPQGEPYRTISLPNATDHSVPVPDQPGTLHVDMPEGPKQTAGDRPHGTPGEDAGNCAQCGRLLIWDGSGKRVNDEWGEYLCPGPRPEGKASAVHVLAEPPAPRTKHRLTVSDIADATAQLLGDGWTAEPGHWETSGIVSGPYTADFTFIVDDENDLCITFDARYEEDGFPEQPDLPDGVKGYDDGVYLELATPSDGLAALAEKSAAAIRAVTGYTPDDFDFESSASRQRHIDTGRYLRKGEAEAV